MAATFEISIVQKALEKAAVAHRSQRRKRSNLPYIVHLVMVKDMVQQNGGDDIACAAALLHDIREDTTVGIDEFPEAVKELVESLTRKPDESKTHSILKLRKSSRSAVLIKLCDRYHNFVDTQRFLDAKMKPEWLDTTRVLLEIAKEKGLQKCPVFHSLQEELIKLG